jgi:hypothetical protein
MQIKELGQKPNSFCFSALQQNYNIFCAIAEFGKGSFERVGCSWIGWKIAGEVGNMTQRMIHLNHPDRKYKR